MQFITKESIVNFLNKHNYDIRKSHYGRWIDQKCTPDVLCIIADCILNCPSAQNSGFFTSVDVWKSSYTVEQVQAIFKKPSPDSDKARNEYDKFFQQPMNLFAYSGILKLQKVKNRNFYTITNKDILEYISLREQNALLFLYYYITQVLNDSDIMQWFRLFLFLQTKQSFTELKQKYEEFMIENTKINHKLEVDRIFTKVINPLSFFGNKLGSERGNISKDIITKDMLMYNRNNFRDQYSNKPKGITRKEHEVKTDNKPNVAYFKYQSAKAKRMLRQYNDVLRNGLTEHLENNQTYDKATHIHHIFPEAYYPTISYYIENLIALTPTQHLNYAHPDGNTKEVDAQYQHLLLLSKADRIRENLNNPAVENIYNFSDFVYVLSIGFGYETRLDIDNMDFVGIMHAINAHF